MIFESSKTVPIPPRWEGSTPSYPWRNLEKPGDSVFISGQKSFYTRATAHQYAKRHGFIVRVRTRDGAPWGHPGVEGIAVWRIS